MSASSASRPMRSERVCVADRRRWRLFRERLAIGRPDQLEHPLGPGQGPQVPFTQLNECQALRQPVSYDLGRRQRHEHLTTRRLRHQPGSTVHGRAEVVTTAFFGLPGVHAHPHAQRGRPRLDLERPLRRDGGGDGVTRPSEHDRHTVAALREHRAAVDRDRLEQQVVVAGQRRAHGRGLLFPPPCRILDVGEQEGHRARRELDGHASTMSPPISATCRGHHGEPASHVSQRRIGAVPERLRTPTSGHSMSPTGRRASSRRFRAKCVPERQHKRATERRPRHPRGRCITTLAFVAGESLSEPGPLAGRLPGGHGASCAPDVSVADRLSSPCRRGRDTTEVDNCLIRMHAAGRFGRLGEKCG